MIFFCCYFMAALKQDLSGIRYYRFVYIPKTEIAFN